MNKFFLSFCCIASMLSMSQCSKDPSDINSATGQFSLRLNLDQTLNTRSAADYNLDVNDFMIEVINAEGAYIKRWENIADMPESVRLNVGTYTLRASYGSSIASGFSAWYFVGEEEFEIKQQVSTPVTVTCALGNVKVAIAYGEQLLKDHTAYTVEVVPETGNSLIFAQDEIRAGYVPAGEVRLNVNLTDIDGNSTYYQTDAFEANPRDFITFKLDTKEYPGNLILTITTDTTTEDHEEVVEIPGFMLPKSEPVVTLSGIDREINNRFYEGQELAAVRPVFNVVAEGGIKSAILKSDYFGYLTPGVSGYDLCNLTDQERKFLKEAGVNWKENITVLGVTHISLADFTPNIRLHNETSAAETFDFILEVTDNFLRSGKNDFTVTVSPPEFSVEPIQNNQVDYAYAYHTIVRTEVTKGNPEKLDFVVRKVQTGEPITVSKQLLSVENGISTWSVSGLEEQTEYALQPFYNAHSKEVQTFITDQTYQIPNGDFNEWYSFNIGRPHTSYDYLYSHFYWDPSSDVENGNGWWSTRNSASASQDTSVGSSFLGTGRATDKTPATAHNSTCPISNGEVPDDYVSQKDYAVRLKSSGWGKSTYEVIVGFGSPNYNTNISSALLFIGSYACSVDLPIGNVTGDAILVNEEIKEGREFTGRPVSIRFEYSYAPYQSDEFIAFSILEHRNGNNVERIAMAKLPDNFQYDTAGEIEHADLYYDYLRMDLRPTHIRLFFSSSKNLGWASGSADYAQGELGIFGITDDAPPCNITIEDSEGIYSGSVLTLDNIILNYKFE